MRTQDELIKDLLQLKIRRMLLCHELTLLDVEKYKLEFEYFEVTGQVLSNED